MSRLEQLRLDRGLTQVKLAAKSGVPKSVISRIEKHRSASPENLKKLADFFHVPASDLLREALPVRDAA